jgi:hypothetical protein
MDMPNNMPNMGGTGGEWSEWLILFFLWNQISDARNSVEASRADVVQELGEVKTQNAGSEARVTQRIADAESRGAVDTLTLQGKVDNCCQIVTSALCNGFNSTQVQNLQSFNSLERGLDSALCAIQGAIKDCCCATQLGLKDLAFQTERGFATLAAEFCKCCCELQQGQKEIVNAICMQTNTLQAAIAAEGRATREMMVDFRMQDLEKQNLRLANEVDNLKQSAAFQQSQAAQNALIIEHLKPRHPWIPGQGGGFVPPGQQS